ncbi:MAG: PadR family transcriptional regulator [Saprospiraceae bacterium]|nr:PadR family transcriptional regulator [Saprospiraceae bacterium]
MKVQNLLENTKQQMRKGILELCILSIINDKEEAYPSDIIERLKKSDLIVVEGTMYPLLSRLKSAGLLQYRWQEYDSSEDSKGGGPPRKYYSLTDDGREFLEGLLGTWDELVGAVSHSTKSLTPTPKKK